MQKTLPIHLNSSPTCFEGSGTGKREKKTQHLKQIKTCPPKTARSKEGASRPQAVHPTAACRPQPLVAALPHAAGRSCRLPAGRPTSGLGPMGPAEASGVNEVG